VERNSNLDKRKASMKLPKRKDGLKIELETLQAAVA